MQQIKDEQIALILGEIENDIEKFKIALNDKDKQLVDLGKLLKAAKNEYQKVVKENKQFREYAITNRKKEEYGQQKTVTRKQESQKYKKVVSESEVEEIEEEQEKTNNRYNIRLKNNNNNNNKKTHTHTKQTGEKEN